MRCKDNPKSPYVYALIPHPSQLNTVRCNQRLHKRKKEKKETNPERTLEPFVHGIFLGKYDRKMRGRTPDGLWRIAGLRCWCPHVKDNSVPPSSGLIEANKE